MSAGSSCQYWLISIPSEGGSKEHAWKNLSNQTTRDQDLSVNYKMDIPQLRVGTLDSLMALSDDLVKLDQYVESITHKTERELRECSKATDALTINQTPVETFLTRFMWDEARYPVKSTLREIVDLIQEQVSKIDDELKVKTSEYNAILSGISALNRKATGNLNTRGLGDIVAKCSKTDFVDTENLTTLLVVVPKHGYKDWAAKYESLCNFVVPRSNKVLHEDADFGLCRVIMFKRVAEEFKLKAREQRYNVRDYVYDPEEYIREEAEKKKLEEDREKVWMSLVRWCKTGYSECFIAWLHLKAIRVFVESVLRYGLPEKVDPQAILLKPHKRSEAKLRKTLQQLYGHLQSTAYTDKDEAGAEFFPYVYIPVNVFAPER